MEAKAHPGLYRHRKRRRKRRRRKQVNKPFDQNPFSGYESRCRLDSSGI
jgi:hypothetical protein